jgi:excisionase family DNA binding protein
MCYTQFGGVVSGVNRKSVFLNLGSAGSTCQAPRMKKLRKVSRRDISASDSARPQSEPILLTIPASAQVLSTTTWAIRELLWSKKIPHIKLGKRFLIDPADLRAFVAQEKEGVA